MFTLLGRIIDLQTVKIREVPTRLEKDKMREYAQLDERYEVSQSVSCIDLIADGISLVVKSQFATALLYLPSEQSETGGDYVFTFVCVYVCVCVCVCAHSVPLD